MWDSQPDWRKEWDAVQVWRSVSEQNHDLATLDRQTILLHLAFGLLPVIGLLSGDLDRFSTSAGPLHEVAEALQTSA